jgi:hypothetical protein
MNLSLPVTRGASLWFHMYGGRSNDRPKKPISCGDSTLLPNPTIPTFEILAIRMLPRRGRTCSTLIGYDPNGRGSSQELPCSKRQRVPSGLCKSDLVTSNFPTYFSQEGRERTQPRYTVFETPGSVRYTDLGAVCRAPAIESLGPITGAPVQ